MGVSGFSVNLLRFHFGSWSVEREVEDIFVSGVGVDLEQRGFGFGLGFGVEVCFKLWCLSEAEFKVCWNWHLAIPALIPIWSYI